MRGQVDRDGAIPDFVGHAFDRRVEGDARIVHDDVEPSEAIDHRLDDPVGRIRIAKIFFKAYDVRIARMCVCERLVGQIDGEDFRAFLGEQVAPLRGRCRRPHR